LYPKEGQEGAGEVKGEEEEMGARRWNSRRTALALDSFAYIEQRTFKNVGKI